jgi:hypothetical protein
LGSVKPYDHTGSGESAKRASLPVNVEFVEIRSAAMGLQRS